MAETIFFESIPSPQSDVDVIANVSVSDVNEKIKHPMATAKITIIKIFKRSDVKVHQVAAPISEVVEKE
jgi:hypothetical protein